LIVVRSLCEFAFLRTAGRGVEVEGGEGSRGGVEDVAEGTGRRGTPQRLSRVLRYFRRLRDQIRLSSGSRFRR